MKSAKSAISSDRKKNKISRGKQRSAARMASIQGLYAWEMSGCSVADIVDNFSQNGASAEWDGGCAPAEEALFSDLVHGVTDNKARLDPMLDSVLSADRRMANMDCLLQVILRTAAYELVYRDDIDVSLSISEYLSVTSAFYFGQEPAMVHGILDQLRGAVAENQADGSQGISDELAKQTGII